MKIVITGAHQTGKTTLALKLAEKLQLPVITDLMREVPAFSKLNTSKPISEFTINEHFAFNSELLESQISFENNFKSFISDRSVFDFIARLVLYKANVFFTEAVFKLTEIAKEQINKADFIFFLLIHQDLPLTGENVNEKNIFLRSFTEKILISLFKNSVSSEKLHFIDFSELEKRVNFVLEILSRKNKSL